MHKKRRNEEECGDLGEFEEIEDGENEEEEIW